MRHEFYNLCQECWLFACTDSDTDTDTSNFVAFEQYDADALAAEMEMLDPSVLGTSNSLSFDLALGSSPRSTFQDTSTRLTHCSVRIQQSCTPQESKPFQTWLANHTGIEAMEVSVFGAGNHNQAIQALVTGLQASTSLQFVALHLLIIRDAFLQTDAVQAIHDLVQNPGTSIRHLSIHLSTRTMIFLEDLPTHILENKVFDALAHTTLTTLAYYGIHPVHPKDKQKAFHAMSTNPTLKRIKIHDFQQDYDGTDAHLSLLAADKMKQWTVRWVTPGPQEQRGDVLQEALEFPLRFETVKVLYHFLRAKPDVIHLIIPTTSV
ncbi:expressed unknown protein [Seminavis robusta]|uniref:Uncharacterized protein n=1 Tax=Seminavis robusta TaxID=568900 RepID=A0A9N8HTI1_9STRA|nr:expressed unknown protein [Seminavis robusta]|eukprot:Sro1666_g289660.1 n/a (321) ;mRNA; r:4168-5130